MTPNHPRATRAMPPESADAGPSPMDPVPFPILRISAGSQVERVLRRVRDEVFSGESLPLSVGLSGGWV